MWNWLNPMWVSLSLWGQGPIKEQDRVEKAKHQIKEDQSKSRATIQSKVKWSNSNWNHTQIGTHF